MNTAPSSWTLSPHAPEFLPEEIAQLESGAMIVCPECQWPHAASVACDKCATYNVDQDRTCGTSQPRPPEPESSSR